MNKKIDKKEMLFDIREYIKFFSSDEIKFILDNTILYGFYKFIDDIIPSGVNFKFNNNICIEIDYYTGKKWLYDNDVIISTGYSFEKLKNLIER